MALTRTDSAKDTVITIDDSAQIAEAENIAQHFRAVLGLQTPLVSLDLRQLERVDISFFQLLLAFNAGLANQSRSLSLKPLPENHSVMQQANLHGIKLELFLTFDGDRA